MPGFDGTGPQGLGPMTGGARGYCTPAGAGYGFSYGRGFGFGRGRGFRRGFGPGYGRGFGFGRGRDYYPAGGWNGPVAYGATYGTPYAMKPEDEINMLRDEAGAIKNELDAINKRIEDLESQSSES